jgi:hypothetical protein
MQTTIADVLVTHLAALANQLAHVLPWVKHLNEDKRVALLADLTQASMQVRYAGEPQALLDVLADWEATAHCVSDKHLTDRLLASTPEQDYTPWEAIRADVPGQTTP